MLQSVFVVGDGLSTRSLFIKNLDLSYLEDTGQHPMRYLQDLLDVFGTVCQLRLFNLLAAACAQFKSEDQAKLVRQSPSGMSEGCDHRHQPGTLERQSVTFLDQPFSWRVCLE